LAWFPSLVAQVAVSAALAYLLHILIEKPVLWLRDRVVP
jgi:peptidoglycan/LPS O-acetylase OafA/YrhL